MPRPYNPRPYNPRPLGYRARQAALAKAQRRAALACGALAVALPVATVLLLWPYMVGIAQALAAALALPVVH